MRLPEFIIKMLRKKSGNDLYLPSDCEFLSLDIESNLGIHIGATTLKRLLGFQMMSVLLMPAPLKCWQNILGMLIGGM